MHRVPRLTRLAALPLMIAAALTGSTATAADGREALARQIGLAAARDRLGDDLPTGRNVPTGHVEGDAEQYVPKNNGQFGSVELVAKSGPSEPLDHASHTAGLIYGPNGLAPGIPTVHAYAVHDWITDGYLRTGSSRPPRETELRLFNHSWVANPDNGAPAVLRRVDYQIDTHDVVMCAGVNNGPDTQIPHMLASAHNAIAVGLTNGESSGGDTRLEKAGRSKPDIAAPANTTSAATCIVTAMTARLIEAADAKAENASAPTSRASRSEVIKALLLAGATKPGDWSPPSDKPLDEHLGAGVVHLDRSLSILKQGPVPPGRVHRRYGWDFRAMPTGEQHTYRFEVNQTTGSASLMLVWNRRVDGLSSRFRIGDGPRWSSAAALADFDLTLVRLDDAGRPHTIASSKSDRDNVEHIFRENLEPGRYHLKVHRKSDGHAMSWDYALAWRIERNE